MAEVREERRLVWDLPVRLFHWLLVLSLIASYVTAKIGFETMEIHMLLGKWTLGLVVFRAGERYAKKRGKLKRSG